MHKIVARSVMQEVESLVPSLTNRIPLSTGAICRQEGRYLVVRHGRAEQVALEEIAPERSKVVELVLAFDAFGGTAQAKGVTESDNGADDGLDSGV